MSFFADALGGFALPTHQITITPTGAYVPNTLTVSVGDQIHWTNYDRKNSHWPGTKDNPGFFLPSAIGPATASGPTPSSTFVAGGPNAVGSQPRQVLPYAESDNPTVVVGTIVINAANVIAIGQPGTVGWVPSSLTVSVGDLIFWQNYDAGNAYWPGPADNPTQFMENEIGQAPPPSQQPPAYSQSTGWTPGSSGTIAYVDSNRNTDATGTIVVK
jgi:plastocyanin